MVVAIIFIAIEAANKNTEAEEFIMEDDGELHEETVNPKLYATLALIIGLINPFTMAIKHLVIKKYTSTYPPLM